MLEQLDDGPALADALDGGPTLERASSEVVSSGG
jgi:hypothetical protein